MLVKKYYDFKIKQRDKALKSEYLDYFPLF